MRINDISNHLPILDILATMDGVILKMLEILKQLNNLQVQFMYS